MSKSQVSYETICFWEDDAVQLEFATNGGGANKVSLIEGQRNFTSFGACEESAVAQVRQPSEVDQRDPTWRARAPQLDEQLYYWKPSFWRNSTR